MNTAFSFFRRYLNLLHLQKAIAVYPFENFVVCLREYHLSRWKMQKKKPKKKKNRKKKKKYFRKKKKYKSIFWEEKPV